MNRVQGFSGALANRTVGVVGGVLSAVVQTLLVVFTMFYLFRDGDAIRYAAYDVLPLDRSQASDIVTRTREVVAATVYGVLVISGIQGSLGGMVFWALGLPSPLLWGVVMFFLSMIPMAGAFLVWAPAAVYLAFSGAWAKAIFLTAWGVLVVGSIDNFLSPLLVGKRTRLHELLIFFSVLGGLQVFGVLGLVLGPVTVAITLALFEVVREANRPPEDTRREDTVIERQAEVRQASGPPPVSRTTLDMADYPGDWLSFEAALDAAFLTASLPPLHQHVIIDPNAPSAVRVFGKSMYVLAAGWMVSVAWLWMATLQQQVLRRGAVPDYFELGMLTSGMVPALLVGAVGYAIDRWAVPAPNRWLQRREWIHAFWWSLLPNLLLLFTVWVMLQEG
jgi:hypothetical protein